MKITDQLKQSIFEAVKTAFSEVQIKLEDIILEHPTVEEFGDYSTNIAMRLKVDPKKIAEKIPGAIVSGGFINFKLPTEFLISEMQKVDREYGKSHVGKGKTVVIDYSAPNIAKRFGIGHLRSTIIGQALYNLLQFQGYKVIGDNHLGDWGTQFGKLLYMIDTYKLEKLTIDELEKLYVQFHAEAETNKDLEDKGRMWFKKLEDGDPKAREIWQNCITISMDEFNKIYDLLNVKIDFAYGESFYEDLMKDVINDAKNLVVESDGAKVIPIEGMKTPLMLLKNDGGTTYATRDLATLKFRQKTWNPDIIIYEVGSEQTLYFKQLFAVAKTLGYVKEGAKLIHTKHGLYRMESGKFSTRKGNTPKLQEILNEAIKRAKELGNNETAEAAGIGAIKYFDLKHEISGDIVFDWETMFALQGDSGPYIQYTYARAKSVLRKSDVGVGSPDPINFSDSGAKTAPLQTEELDLLRYIYRFPEVVELAARQYAPNVLCTYLFELAKRFNNFYNNCPIVGNDLRIKTTAATAQILASGLNLLGIKALEKM